uniref:Retrotransposon protein, putative, Ty1-copia subclass n=1 Tax=Tanacetum cinerariifolium TaxID=118510 RepID=A0A6L2LCM4_TANCI|nr:retrotransposon protein, putative, Ty1-copia subclass [Tanacetum cinerariifolium]
MKKPSQSPRGVLVSAKVGFKQVKQVYRHVSKNNNVNSGGKRKDAEPTIEQRLIPVDHDSKDEAASVDNEMTNFLASKKVAYGLILELLKKEKLYAKISKCEFWLQEFQFLGHVIYGDGLHVDSIKIKNFSKIAKPLTILTHKYKEYVWGEEQERAFQTLKDKLCNAPLLALLNGSKDFVVYYDTSGLGLGCVLMQRRKKELNMRQHRWIELFSDYDCEIRYHLGKENVVALALCRKERFKTNRIRAMNMTILLSIKDKILAAQNEASKAVNAPTEMLLTKSTHFLPIREDHKIDRIARLYHNEIITRHGVPISIISDNDSHFTSSGGCPMTACHVAVALTANDYCMYEPLKRLDGNIRSKPNSLPLEKAFTGRNGKTSSLASKKANSSGSSFWNVKSSSTSTTSIVEKIDKIERLVIDGKVTLVDDEGKLLAKVDSSVDHESYENDDYDFDPYDADMYEGHFSAKVLHLKSNLLKGCKEQGNVLVSPKEVESKSTHSRTKPIPPIPIAPAGHYVAPEILAAHNAWIKGSKEIAGLMLMTMEPEIQRNLEPLKAHEMLQEQEEGQSVSSYVLKIKGYIDNLERLGHPVTLGLGVCLILIGLRKEYDGFVQNYNMHNMGKTVNELNAMLNLYEQTLPKKTLMLFMLLKPIKSRKYLDELLKKKKNAASGAGGSGIFVIELNTILNRSWIYDTGCGTHICNTTQGLRNNMVYFSAIPRDCIFEIDLSNSYTNETSIYAVSNKRDKVDLDSALLWHCRLRHISKKRIEKLQHDGLLDSSDLSAFEKCVNCMSRKMARKPYTHQVERAKDLVGLIHIDVCGPFKIMSRQGESYFVTFTDDFNHYGYVYLLKHKHEVFETFKVFQKEVENQLGKTIKLLHSDREGEYVSQEFLDHLEDYGIITHRTPPYIPQHNENSLINQEASGSLEDLKIIQEENTHPSIDTSLNHEEDDLEIDEPQSDIVPIRRSTRTRHTSDRMCLYIDAEEHKLGDLGEPANNKAALFDPESEKWLNVMNVEMQSMKDNEVWVLFELPPNGKTVGSKWLLKKKTDMDGVVHTYKARLVAKGYTQTSGIDYEETFSLVADIRAIRILIAIAAYYDYEIWQMDQFCMENSKRGSIPMKEKLKLSKSQGASTPVQLKHMQNVPYASAVGSIMYAVRCTRPDVAFTQSVTSRFQQNPGDLKRELRVSCYTDAGYLTDADDLKSQTGYVFVLNGGAVDWKSAKQSIFATSSTKVEYIAAFDASKEAVWVKKFISGLGVVPIIKETISMYCDHTGAIAIANESGITKGARHFNAKVHYLREVIEYGDIKLEKVHTDDNLADPFTIALAFLKHSEHTMNIGMLPASSLIGGYHAVPPLITGTFMPPKPDLIFHTTPIAIETDHFAFTPVKTSIPAATPKPTSPKLTSPKSNSSRKKGIEKLALCARVGNHKQYASLANKKPQKHMVPTAMLTQSKLVFNTTVRPVSADMPKIMVTRPRLTYLIVTKSKSPIKRHITRSPSPKTSNSPPRVTTAQALVVRCCSGYAKKMGMETKGNPQYALKDKGVINSGCSRHMIGNMSYLSEFKELNGGYVAFGGNPNGGKIFGKGKIKTGKLDFDDVYFVKELKFDLFSVSQMTLIEAARTMLADLLLPILFWAEAVNIACCVQNRVLVTKPHNNTPYKLLHGRSPSIGFIRPFGCPVTILNTLDPLENKPNVAGSGPTWLFDIDRLTWTMNYQPIITRNQTNPSAGFQDKFNAEKAGEEVDQQYVLFPMWSSGSTNPQNNDEDASFDEKKHDDKTKKEAKGKSPVESSTGYRYLSAEFEDCSKNNSNEVNAADASQLHDDPDMPELEDITYSDDENIVGAEADFNNLKTSITVSPIPTIRIHKDHPVSQIIGDMSSTTQTRSMTRVVKDQAFEEPNYPDKVYKVVTKLYGLHQAPRAWYETLANYLLENGFHRGKIDQTLFIKKQKGDILLVKQKKGGIFISQDKYVVKILRMFGLTERNSASTPIDTKKPLLKDPDVKRIFRYLKVKPHLGLWYPKDSPFDLVANSDSDYAGASLDRKSTSRGCQLVGCRLISWQCKKQTVVATSSPEAKYFWNTVAIKQVTNVARLQALVDKKKVVVTEAAIREVLRLDYVEGVDCLSNEEIFAELARMGYEKPSTKLTFYKAFFSSR